jgi:hypothetical protein
VTIDAAHTHVLAIGIEVYDAGADWELPGAARAADRFVQWALDCGIPREHVLRACSRVREPALPPADGARELAPKHRDLSQALVELAPPGELLLVYWCGHGLVCWCGHGVLKADRRRALFTADATQEYLANFNVDDVQRHLRSTRGWPAHQQLCSSTRARTSSNTSTTLRRRSCCSPTHRNAAASSSHVLRRRTGTGLPVQPC